ncbi:putative mfs transporter [Diaporthe ampelina]|uniref:Putative mfs transporter n=1 Tax=Diaporthe ampelina TaxID=1214573 RepID=A0A0G2I9T3_9PEZI|nr:putative mfs transporter [Diaporthe ampelina]
MAQQTTPAHSQQSELAPMGQFDIMQESSVDEKGEFGMFDPTSSANRERYLDPEDDMAKENAPFLSRDVEKEEAKKAAPEHVTWMSLPHKGQLLILFMCRFVDFLQVASLQAYVFYQLKHMAEQRTIQTGGAEAVLSDSQISAQAGLLTGCFTGAQVLTAIAWGKAADSSRWWGGRKMVLLIGTLGTAIGCFGYGFSQSFAAAMAWRIFSGSINGLVGIIRTMISEITVERKYQSRAFLILPMSFNVAGILGPIIGGWLADPSMTLPGWFGPGAPFHSPMIEAYPFALPSIMNAVFLFVTFLAVFFGLEETSKSKKNSFDPGLYAVARAKAFVLRRPLDYVYHSRTGYSELRLDEKSENTQPAAVEPKKRKTLPFSRLWTKNVICTLLSQAFYDFHLGAFTNIWSLFLSSPRPGFTPAHVDSNLPAAAEIESRGTGLGKRNLLWFAGGLGMPASTVGNATSILGVLGMLLQVVMYPPVHARLGTLRSFRYFLVIFPVAYLLAPFLAVMPQSTGGDGATTTTSTSTVLWFGIVLILFLHTSARTMTLPASIILLNNCSPHPSVLGTIHGIGQSVSAGFRTVGPIVGGYWYGIGLDWGMVAFSWWAVGAVAVGGWVASLMLYEGSGKEIELEGDDE